MLAHCGVLDMCMIVYGIKTYYMIIPYLSIFHISGRLYKDPFASYFGVRQPVTLSRLLVDLPLPSTHGV